jgi:tetratricopeptide (TPR) repeat protein
LRSALFMLSCSCALTFCIAAPVFCSKVNQPDPRLFPGKGLQKDWIEACEITDNANESNPEDGVKRYKVAIEKYPFFWSFYYGLGVYYERLKDDRDAEDAFLAAIDCEKKYPARPLSPASDTPKRQIGMTYFGLATICGRNKRTEEAESYYKKAIDQSPVFWIDYANFLKKLGRDDEAATALKSYHENTPVLSAPGDYSRTRF